MAARVGVQVARDTKVVTTYRSSLGRLVKQTHRGYTAWITVPGEQPKKCCFHQKRSAAQAHGDLIARRLEREREA